MISASTPKTARTLSAVRTSSVVAVGHDLAVADHQQPVAQRPSQPEVVRRDHDRDAAILVEPAQQRRHLELVAEIERRRRLVEQEKAWVAGAPQGRRSPAACDLPQCRRDHDALLLAAAQRCEQPVLQVQRAGRRQRLLDHRDIGGPFDLERAEMRVAPHHRDFGHGVVERQLRLLRHDRHAPRQRRAARTSREVRRPASPSRAADCRVPASIRSSVVLPDPFGPRMPTMPAAGTSRLTPRRTGCLRRTRTRRQLRGSMGDQVERDALAAADPRAVRDADRDARRAGNRSRRCGTRRSRRTGSMPRSAKASFIPAWSGQSEPRLVEPRLAHGHQQRPSARRDERIEQFGGRTPPQRLYGLEAAPRRIAPPPTCDGRGTPGRRTPHA